MLNVYIYDHTGVAITQLFDVIDFDCTNKLNSYDSASFTLSLRDKNVVYDYLKEYNRVKITREKKGTVKTFIKGIIKAVEATDEGVVVTVLGMEYLLDKKLVNSAKNYTSTSLYTIISQLLSEINARYDTGLTVHEDTTTTAVDLIINKNASLLQALKSLTEQGFNFRIVDNKLLVSEIVGEDRTSGDNFYLFKWDFVNETDRNITKRNIAYDAETIATAVTEPSTTFVEDATAISEFGRIEENFSISTNVVATLNQKLLEKKGSTRQIEVTPRVDDFFFSEVGDVLKVEIDTGNDVGYFNGSTILLEKSVKGLGLIDISAKLSSTNEYTKTLLERIKDYDDRIKKLELS